MIPNLLHKHPLPEKLPEEMQEVVDEINYCENKEIALKKAYDAITDKFYGHRGRLILNLFDILTTNLEKLWKRKGYLHCHYQVYLLRTLLVKSKFFSEEDIGIRFNLTFFFFPHTYLIVKLSPKKELRIDPWNKALGITYGDYSRGFHMKTSK